MQAGKEKRKKVAHAKLPFASIRKQRTTSKTRKAEIHNDIRPFHSGKKERARERKKERKREKEREKERERKRKKRRERKNK